MKTLKHKGLLEAPIVIVTEPPNQKCYDDLTKVMRDESMAELIGAFNAAGVSYNDVILINPCPPIPQDCNGSDARTNKFVQEYEDQFWDLLDQTQPKIVVAMGKIAARQVFRRSIKITEIQGTLQTTEGLDCPVLPTLSPGNVVSRPEVKPKFESDMRILAFLVKNNWDPSCLTNAISESKYEWCYDLSDLLKNRPKAICFDCETAAQVGHNSTGLATFNRRPTIKFAEDGTINEVPRGYAVPLIVQISHKKKHSLVIPMDPDYCPDATVDQITMLKAQLKELLEDPNIKKTGHNLNFDIRVMANQEMYLKGWYADTLMLSFCLDENMQKKSLDEGVARWLPEYAGYSKEFEAQVDYNKMREVPHDLMLPYAGGDTDVGYQLAGVTLRELKKDERMWNCFQRIQMPAMRAFTEISMDGWKVDPESLREMLGELEDEEAVLYDRLIALIPNAVKNAIMEEMREGQTFRDVFNFGSPILIRKILFTEEGYNLEPVVFTAGTMNLHDESDWLASTSTKKHLPYFDSCPFVKVLEEYVTLKHMMNSFVGHEQHIVRFPARKGAKKMSTPTKRMVEVEGRKYIEEILPEKGIWQHMDLNYRVHPVFHLSRVVTGRTSCSEPNIQQVPKRGKWAKRYRKVYLPDREGGFLVAADLSQIELRLVAWMANELTMLQIYRDGGDIHAATGASVSGIDIRAFYAMEETDPDQFEFKRYLAKAVNFGFIYGAWWTTFQTYAKTTFGIDVTDKDAKLFRTRFFDQFSGLPGWHEDMKSLAHRDKAVRSMHGALRRLPAIDSPEEWVVQSAERQAVNSPIQRMGSDLGLIGLTRFHRDCPKDLMRVKGFVHDQIIVSVDHEEHVAEAESALKFYMQTLPLNAWFGIDAPLPILADVETGTNMGNLAKRKGVIAQAPAWYRGDLDAA